MAEKFWEHPTFIGVLAAPFVRPSQLRKGRVHEVSESLALSIDLVRSSPQGQDVLASFTEQDWGAVDNLRALLVKLHEVSMALAGGGTAPASLCAMVGVIAQEAEALAIGETLLLPIGTEGAQAAVLVANKTSEDSFTVTVVNTDPEPLEAYHPSRPNKLDMLYKICAEIPDVPASRLLDKAFLLHLLSASVKDDRENMWEEVYEGLLAWLVEAAVPPPAAKTAEEDKADKGEGMEVDEPKAEPAVEKSQTCSGSDPRYLLEVWGDASESTPAAWGRPAVSCGAYAETVLATARLLLSRAGMDLHKIHLFLLAFAELLVQSALRDLCRYLEGLHPLAEMAIDAGVSYVPVTLNPVVKVLNGELLSGGHSLEALSNSCHTILLYIGALWSPSSQDFLDVASAAYTTSLKPQGVEIVFLSADNSEEMFREHTSRMPWPCIPFQHAGELGAEYPVQREEDLPMVVAFRNNGTFLSVSKGADTFSLVEKLSGTHTARWPDILQPPLALDDFNTITSGVEVFIRRALELHKAGDVKEGSLQRFHKLAEVTVRIERILRNPAEWEKMQETYNAQDIFLHRADAVGGLWDAIPCIPARLPAVQWDGFELFSSCNVQSFLGATITEPSTGFDVVKQVGPAQNMEEALDGLRQTRETVSRLVSQEDHAADTVVHIIEAFFLTALPSLSSGVWKGATDQQQRDCLCSLSSILCSYTAMLNGVGDVQPRPLLVGALAAGIAVEVLKHETGLPLCNVLRRYKLDTFHPVANLPLSSLFAGVDGSSPAALTAITDVLSFFEEDCSPATPFLGAESITNDRLCLEPHSDTMAFLVDLMRAYDFGTGRDATGVVQFLQSDGMPAECAAFLSIALLFKALAGPIQTIKRTRVVPSAVSFKGDQQEGMAVLLSDTPLSFSKVQPSLPPSLTRVESAAVQGFMTATECRVPLLLNYFTPDTRIHHVKHRAVRDFISNAVFKAEIAPCRPRGVLAPLVEQSPAEAVAPFTSLLGSCTNEYGHSPPDSSGGAIMAWVLSLVCALFETSSWGGVDLWATEPGKELLGKVQAAFTGKLAEHVGIKAMVMLLDNKMAVNETTAPHVLRGVLSGHLTRWYHEHKDEIARVLSGLAERDAVLSDFAQRGALTWEPYGRMCYLCKDKGLAIDLAQGKVATTGSQSRPVPGGIAMHPDFVEALGSNRWTCRVLCETAQCLRVVLEGTAIEVARWKAANECCDMPSRTPSLYKDRLGEWFAPLANRDLLRRADGMLRSLGVELAPLRLSSSFVAIALGRIEDMEVPKLQEYTKTGILTVIQFLSSHPQSQKEVMWPVFLEKTKEVAELYKGLVGDTPTILLFDSKKGTLLTNKGADVFKKNEPPTSWERLSKAAGVMNHSSEDYIFHACTYNRPVNLAPGAMTYEGDHETWICEVMQEAFEESLPFTFSLPEKPLPPQHTRAHLLALHGTTWKLAVVDRTRRMVEVYALVPNARRLFKTLIYTSNADYSLGTAKMVRPAKGKTKAAGNALEQYPPADSISIFRINEDLGGRETFIPSRLLRGIVPDEILECKLWLGADGVFRGDGAVGVVEIVIDEEELDTAKICILPTRKEGNSHTLIEMRDVAFMSGMALGRDEVEEYDVPDPHAAKVDQLCSAGFAWMGRERLAELLTTYEYNTRHTLAHLRLHHTAKTECSHTDGTLSPLQELLSEGWSFRTAVAALQICDGSPSAASQWLQIPDNREMLEQGEGERGAWHLLNLRSPSDSLDALRSTLLKIDSLSKFKVWCRRVMGHDEIMVLMYTNSLGCWQFKRDGDHLTLSVDGWSLVSPPPAIQSLAAGLGEQCCCLQSGNRYKLMVRSHPGPDLPRHFVYDVSPVMTHIIPTTPEAAHHLVMGLLSQRRYADLAFHAKCDYGAVPKESLGEMWSAVAEYPHPDAVAGYLHYVLNHLLRDNHEAMCEVNSGVAKYMEVVDYVSAELRLTADEENLLLTLASSKSNRAQLYQAASPEVTLRGHTRKPAGVDFAKCVLPPPTTTFPSSLRFTPSALTTDRVLKAPRELGRLLLNNRLTSDSVAGKDKGLGGLFMYKLLRGDYVVMLSNDDITQSFAHLQLRLFHLSNRGVSSVGEKHFLEVIATMTLFPEWKWPEVPQWETHAMAETASTAMETFFNTLWSSYSSLYNSAEAKKVKVTVIQRCQRIRSLSESKNTAKYPCKDIMPQATDAEPVGVSCTSRKPSCEISQDFLDRPLSALSGLLGTAPAAALGMGLDTPLPSVEEEGGMPEWYVALRDDVAAYVKESQQEVLPVVTFLAELKETVTPELVDEIRKRLREAIDSVGDIQKGNAEPMAALSEKIVNITSFVSKDEGDNLAERLHHVLEQFTRKHRSITMTSMLSWYLASDGTERVMKANPFCTNAEGVITAVTDVLLMGVQIHQCHRFLEPARALLRSLDRLWVLLRGATLPEYQQSGMHCDKAAESRKIAHTAVQLGKVLAESISYGSTDGLEPRLLYYEYITGEKLPQKVVDKVKCGDLDGGVLPTNLLCLLTDRFTMVVRDIHRPVTVFTAPPTHRRCFRLDRCHVSSSLMCSMIEILKNHRGVLLASAASIASLLFKEKDTSSMQKNVIVSLDAAAVVQETEELQDVLLDASGRCMIDLAVPRFHLACHLFSAFTVLEDESEGPPRVYHNHAIPSWSEAEAMCPFGVTAILTEIRSALRQGIAANSLKVTRRRSGLPVVELIDPTYYDMLKAPFAKWALLWLVTNRQFQFMIPSDLDHEALLSYISATDFGDLPEEVRKQRLVSRGTSLSWLVTEGKQVLNLARRWVHVVLPHSLSSPIVTPGASVQEAANPDVAIGMAFQCYHAHGLPEREVRKVVADIAALDRLNPGGAASKLLRTWFQISDRIFPDDPAGDVAFADPTDLSPSHLWKLSHVPEVIDYWLCHLYFPSPSPALRVVTDGVWHTNVMRSSDSKAPPDLVARLADSNAVTVTHPSSWTGESLLAHALSQSPDLIVDAGGLLLDLRELLPSTPPVLHPGVLSSVQLPYFARVVVLAPHSMTFEEFICIARNVLGQGRATTLHVLAQSWEKAGDEKPTPSTFFKHIVRNSLRSAPNGHRAYQDLLKKVFQVVVKKFVENHKKGGLAPLFKSAQFAVSSKIWDLESEGAAWNAFVGGLKEGQPTEVSEKIDKMVADVGKPALDFFDGEESLWSHTPWKPDRTPPIRKVAAAMETPRAACESETSTPSTQMNWKVHPDRFRCDPNVWNPKSHPFYPLHRVKLGPSTRRVPFPDTLLVSHTLLPTRSQIARISPTTVPRVALVLWASSDRSDPALVGITLGEADAIWRDFTSCGADFPLSIVSLDGCVLREFNGGVPAPQPLLQCLRLLSGDVTLSDSQLSMVEGVLEDVGYSVRRDFFAKCLSPWNLSIDACQGLSRLCYHRAEVDSTALLEGELLFRVFKDYYTRSAKLSETWGKVVKGNQASRAEVQMVLIRLLEAAALQQVLPADVLEMTYTLPFDEFGHISLNEFQKSFE